MEVTVKATRIATYGAQKMTAQGYSFEAAKHAGNYFVQKPIAADTDGPITELDLEFRDFYTVTYKETVKVCGCPFCQENGTCKHIVWLGWQLEMEADLVARVEKWAQEEADFDPYGKF